MDFLTRSTLKILTLVTLFAAGLWLAYSARQILIWVGTACFLAVAINPAVDALAKRLPKHSRTTATAIVFVAGVVFLSVFLGTLIPPIASQIQTFAHNVPHYIDEVTTGNNVVAGVVRQYNLGDEIQRRQAELIKGATSASGALVNLATSLFAGFAAFVTILVLTFFMLLEGPYWLKQLWRLDRSDDRDHHQALVHKMYGAVTGYVAGNLLTSLLAAVVTVIMLLILRVPYAISLGILVGLIDLIPLVGATIAAVVVITVALFTSQVAALVMFVFYVVYQQIENHALQPIIYGKTVQMSPLLVLVAVLIGAAIGGMIGALVAIPIAASAQIVARDLMSPRTTKKA